MGLFSFVGGIIGGNKAAKASKKATAAQVAAQEKAIAEQRRQYDQSREDFSPYRESGTAALQQMNDLLGVVTANPMGLDQWNASGEAPVGDGAGNITSSRQQTALDALRNSPFYQSLYRTGEEATLQNASATGGIRGGNTQRGLADFGADTFAATIQNQLQNLSGLSNMGLGATNSITNVGQNTANNVSQSLTAQGDARASGYLTRGGIRSQQWNNAGSFLDDAVKSIFSGGGF